MCKSKAIKREELNIECVKRGERYIIYFDGIVSRICWDISKNNWEMILFNKDNINTAQELYWYATI